MKWSSFKGFCTYIPDARIPFDTFLSRRPEDLINSLKQNENSQGIHENMEKYLTPGNKLLIVEGPFEGYEASLFSKKTDDRINCTIKYSWEFCKNEIKSIICWAYRLIVLNDGRAMKITKTPKFNP